MSTAQPANRPAVTTVIPPLLEMTTLPPKLRAPIAITRGEGRGIVIPGGGIYLRAAWVTIRMVRHFGCDLPIELWLLPWEKITEPEKFMLDLYGVDVRKADPGYCLNESIHSTHWSRPIWLAGWQLKIQAVLQSRFREVVFLDADCYPVEPNWLEPLTAQSGTFVGDIVESDHLLSESACQWVGVKRCQPVDSGAFYVDKTNTAWCDIVGALNGPEFVRQTYNAFFGDKDTWWVSHALAGIPFHVLQRGTLIQPRAGIRHANGLLHRTADKFTSEDPANTPQHGRQRLEGDHLTEQFLRAWPPLTIRSRRDWEIIQGVLEFDEYHVSTLPRIEYAVDAGGHVGSFSAALQRRWPQARLLAFEPHPDNARLFRLNAPTAELVEAAIGPETMSVGLKSSSPGDTAFETIEGDGVAMVRLSDFVKDWPRIDILKIDIEGDEEKVLQDLETAGQLRKVNRIVGEWHNPPRLYRMMELLRHSHHLTVCCHHWNHGYFEAVRNDQ